MRALTLLLVLLLSGCHGCAQDRKGPLAGYEDLGLYKVCYYPRGAVQIAPNVDCPAYL